jgi:hypothetical protein
MEMWIKKWRKEIKTKFGGKTFGKQSLRILSVWECKINQIFVEFGF